MKKIPLPLWPIAGAAAVVGAGAYLMSRIVKDINEIYLPDGDFFGNDGEIERDEDTFNPPNDISTSENDECPFDEGNNAPTVEEFFGLDRNNPSSSTLENNPSNEVETQNKEPETTTPVQEDKPPIDIDKIERLEEILTYQELLFTSEQKEYVRQIIEKVRNNEIMRVAVLLTMDFDGKNAIEAFTDNQFQAIKKILR